MFIPFDCHIARRGFVLVPDAWLSASYWHQGHPARTLFFRLLNLSITIDFRRIA